MAVMKKLVIGGVTYDTVGEASVTQVQTTGTKIATVSIDGATTDLYAPSGGGSSVDPATATPLMDGTAAVGSSTKYAREDHVHPADTSKQATLVSGTNIKTVNSTSLLGSGDVAVQPTLVSGTNIKTINNESLLGSGNITIQGGGTALTTQEVEDAVDAAFVVEGHTVTVSLTNAKSVGDFSYCIIYALDSYTDYTTYVLGEELGRILTANGSTEVTVPSDGYGICVNFACSAGTPYVPTNGISGTGGVSWTATMYRTGGDYEAVEVVDDGTITFDSVDYDW